MRVLVTNVAAESGGALTILNALYLQYCEDISNIYFICVSKAILKSTSNVTVLSFPWVKNSWFHRLWFDFFTAQRLLKQHQIDEIISLQNVILPITRVPQILYLQLSLPFEDIRFSILRSPNLWIYQNVIGSLIIRSVKRAKQVIVQTKWMKDAVARVAKVSTNKICVLPPKLNVEILGTFSADKWNRDFFYPAAPFTYKNHITLLKAMIILKQRGVTNYRILLTIERQQLPKECESLVNQIKDNIVFLGSLPHQEVMKLYCTSVLVFPSYIETYGLPLKEASLCGAPIIASDRPFSREILVEYNCATYFPPRDAAQLTDCMMKLLKTNNSTRLESL